MQSGDAPDRSNSLMKGLGRVVVGSAVGGLVGAASFFAVDALIPRSSLAETDFFQEVKDGFRESYNQWNKEYGDDYSVCSQTSKDASHDDMYESGKFMAQILNAVEQEGLNGIKGERVRDGMIRTQTDFSSYALLYLKYAGEDKLTACYMAKWKPFDDQTWSSIHSGLTDYLSPTMKARFFAVPER
jgi:hypothetical protein